MTRQLTILTGASRGMGHAMALQLIQPGSTLLCMSRSTSDTLAMAAREAGATLLQWTEDLSDSGPVAARLEDWLQSQAGTPWADVTLINNAGVIPQIGTLSGLKPDDLARALRVGIEAPMQLTAAFLRATWQWNARRKVLNISSGLGRKPMAAQAAYCASKAAMDHFTRCLALEEAIKPQGARVCALAPGVIDTDMQVQLRGADPAHFPDRSYFVKLQEGGQLTSPEEAARRVLAFLARPDFGAQPVADVRD